NLFGLSTGWSPLSLTLPVGISFYTFQSLSYTIDVYRGTISAETRFIRFAGYVAFFPQLVAGPIERADQLLPQFSRTLRIFGGDIREGASLMVRGLFKKVVLADSLGRLVELSHNTSGITAPILLLGTAAFDSKYTAIFQVTVTLREGSPGGSDFHCVPTSSVYILP